MSSLEEIFGSQNRETYSNQLFLRRSSVIRGTRETRVIFEKYPLDITDRTLKIGGRRSKVKGAEQVDRLDFSYSSREREKKNSRIAVNEDNWIWMETAKPFNRNLASLTFQRSLAYSNLRHRDQRRRRANLRPKFR